MKHLWQRKDNPNFTKGEFKLSSPYKPYEKVAIAVFFIVFFPVFLVIYPIYKLIIGAALVTAQFAFYLQHKLFSGKKSAPHSIFQFVRSYISTLASRIPHINCGVRKWLYKLSGIKIGGKNVFVGGFGVFDDVAPENIVIEDHATISFDVTIVAHGPRPSIKDDSEKMVIFREYSYVGAGTLILPGVEIGTYAIVGAGSVVTKDVPPGAVVGGAPARILYYREGWGPDGKIE